MGRSSSSRWTKLPFTSLETNEKGGLLVRGVCEDVSDLPASSSLFAALGFLHAWHASPLKALPDASAHEWAVTQAERLCHSFASGASRTSSWSDRQLQAAIQLGKFRLRLPPPGSPAGHMLLPIPLDVAIPRRLLSAVGAGGKISFVDWLRSLTPAGPAASAASGTRCFLLRHRGATSCLIVDSREEGRPLLHMFDPLGSTLRPDNKRAYVVSFFASPGSGATGLPFNARPAAEQAEDFFMRRFHHMQRLSETLAASLKSSDAKVAEKLASLGSNNRFQSGLRGASQGQANELSPALRAAVLANAIVEVQELLPAAGRKTTGSISGGVPSPVRGEAGIQAMMEAVYEDLGMPGSPSSRFGGGPPSLQRQASLFVPRDGGPGSPPMSPLSRMSRPDTPTRAKSLKSFPLHDLPTPSPPPPIRTKEAKQVGRRPASIAGDASTASHGSSSSRPQRLQPYFADVSKAFNDMPSIKGGPPKQVYLRTKMAVADPIECYTRKARSEAGSMYDMPVDFGRRSSKRAMSEAGFGRSQPRHVRSHSAASVSGCSTRSAAVLTASHSLPAPRASFAVGRDHYRLQAAVADTMHASKAKSVRSAASECDTASDAGRSFHDAASVASGRSRRTMQVGGDVDILVNGSSNPMSKLGSPGVVDLFSDTASVGASSVGTSIGHRRSIVTPAGTCDSPGKVSVHSAVSNTTDQASSGSSKSGKSRLSTDSAFGASAGGLKGSSKKGNRKHKINNSQRIDEDDKAPVTGNSRKFASVWAIVTNFEARMGSSGVQSNLKRWRCGSAPAVVA